MRRQVSASVRAGELRCFAANCFAVKLPIMRSHFLLLPLFCAKIAGAQPPDAPSTIADPTTPIYRPPIAPPDPPLIAPAELQTLLGGATRVTLSAQNAPLEDVVKVLLAGTDIRFSQSPQGGQQQTLSVDWKEKPFWSAAAEIETLSGRIWDGRYSDGLALNGFGDLAGTGFGGLVGAASPLVTIVANSISRSSNRTKVLGRIAQKPAPRPDRDFIQMALMAYFDPKLRVQSTAIRGLKFLPKGEDKLRLGTDNRFAYVNAPRTNTPILSLSLPFPVETAPGTQFDSISGVFHCVVVARTEPFSVPDVLATPQVRKKVGLSQHELVGAEVVGSQLTIRLSATTGEAKPARIITPFPLSFFSTLRVRDGAGQELPRLGNSSTGTRPEGNFRFRVKTPKGEVIPGPYSLEWPLITEIRSLDVPFELRDVTVP